MSQITMLTVKDVQNILQVSQAKAYEIIRSLNIDKSKLYWLAPGSNRYVWKKGDFQSKAKIAYDNAIDAISYEGNGNVYSAKQKWREIYGTKFPI